MAYRTIHTGKDGVKTVTSSDAASPAAPDGTAATTASPKTADVHVDAPSGVAAAGAVTADGAPAGGAPADGAPAGGAPGGGAGAASTTPAVKMQWGKVHNTYGSCMFQPSKTGRWAQAGAWTGTLLGLDAARLAVFGKTGEDGEKYRPVGRIIIEGGAAALALGAALRHGNAQLHGRL